MKLMELLGESLADETSMLPAWHLEELDRRTRHADGHPEQFEAWEDVFTRLTRIK
jgi:hypothetical protein